MRIIISPAKKMNVDDDSLEFVDSLNTSNPGLRRDSVSIYGSVSI